MIPMEEAEQTSIRMIVLLLLLFARLGYDKHHPFAGGDHSRLREAKSLDAAVSAFSFMAEAQGAAAAADEAGKEEEEEEYDAKPDEVSTPRRVRNPRKMEDVREKRLHGEG